MLSKSQKDVKMVSINLTLHLNYVQFHVIFKKCQTELCIPVITLYCTLMHEQKIQFQWNIFITTQNYTYINLIGTGYVLL